VGTNGSAGTAAAVRQSGAADHARPGPIDRVYLSRFTLGNAELEREVLELFAGQAPHYLERLRGAASNRDWKEAAHTLKGSAAAVGARRVASFAELAERLDVEIATAEAVSHRVQAVAAVAAAVEEACGYIARAFAPTPADPIA
jgi:HPt (histidine-containing phosphotransfer) domain-containing protein